MEDLVLNPVKYVKEYMEKDTENSRFHSWRHCHEIFKKYIERKEQISDNEKDLLALNLAFYLASWGMYRASGFLLDYDYKIHYKAVEIVTKSEYRDLLDISAEKLRDNGNVDLLNDVSEKISDCYKKFNNNKAPTDTLVTKILLGTLGCVPAFDSYFCEALKCDALKEYNFTKAYNTKNIKKIACYYRKHKEEFEGLGTDYPPMKLIDMCFWQLGRDLTE